MADYYTNQALMNTNAYKGFANDISNNDTAFSNKWNPNQALPAPAATPTVTPTASSQAAQNSYMQGTAKVWPSSTTPAGTTPVPSSQTTPAVTPAALPTPNTYQSAQDLAASQLEQSRQAQIASANQQAAAAKQQVQNQQAQLPAQYDPQRSQAYQLGMQGALGDQERLAAQGLINSGTGDTTRAQRQMSTSNQVGQLNQQQSAQMNNLAQSIMKIDADNNAGINTINAQTASQLAQMTMSNYWQSQQADTTKASTALQERALGADITGIDPLTGMVTDKAKNEAFSQNIQKSAQTGTFVDPVTGDKIDTMSKQAFDQDKLNTIWDHQYKAGVFDYQKSRDAVADKQWLDNFQWNKNPDNPQQRAQILQNQIQDINLERQSDPNSPENQIRGTAAATADAQLQQLQAISPEMTKEQFNVGLDKIRADIAYTNKSTALMGTGGGGGGGGGGSSPSLAAIGWKDGVSTLEKLYGNVDKTTGSVTYSTQGKKDAATWLADAAKSGAMDEKNFNAAAAAIHAEASDMPA